MTSINSRHGVRMVLSLVEDTLDDLLRSTYQAIHCDGRSISPTRGPAREVVGASLELTNPRARLSRTETRRREVSTIAELCWYLSGTNAAAPIVFYLQQYADDMEADGTIHGGYGPRLFGTAGEAQLHVVIDSLKANPASRRAVVQIFDHTDLGPERYKDVPCTCTLQFLLRDGELHLVVNMRSNDAYLGLPHDVFAFTMLQELVARSLDVDIGRYIHTVGSLHLYDRDHDDVTTYLGEGWQSTANPMPPMPIGDPWNHVKQLLAAEAQIRSLTPFEAIDLPADAYWADLARVLAAWVARKIQQRPESATAIRGSITLDSFRDFI
ncbi:thymidylate synthase [Georgenia halophila]|uniref:thymidylate synthase n=1 Tax=Georgenia halophila TaxID=620889 RepID=A0ABP8L2W3_9MICO